MRDSGCRGEDSAVGTVDSGDAGGDESVVGEESVGDDRESGGDMS